MHTDEVTDKALLLLDTADTDIGIDSCRSWQIESSRRELSQMSAAAILTIVMIAPTEAEAEMEVETDSKSVIETKVEGKLIL